MTASTLTARKTLIVAVLATLYLALPVLAADPDDALLNMLPKDSMFCLCINNFNESLGKLDQYMAGASPIPVSLAMMINMQLGAVIGDPMLTGIDLGGNFAVFAVPPQADEMEPVVGMLIPVTDYKTFVDKNPNCKVGEDGTAILSAPNSPMGGFVMKEAGNGKYALVVSELVGEKLSVLAGSINLAKSQTPLIRRLNASQAKDAATAPAWAYMNLAGLYEKYNKDALGMLEMTQMGMGQTGGPAEMMAFQFKLFAEMFKQFGGQADSLTLTLTPEPTILSVDIAMRAKDGSELAKMMVADKNSEGYKLTGYLDNNNAVNGLMKMNRPFMQAFYDKMFDVMEAATENPTSKEQTAKMKALTQKAFAAMGDEMSFSFSYAGMKPPFKLQEVVEVKDPAAMKALMGEGLDYANGLYKAMGLPVELKYEPGTTPYKNTTIDTVSISVTASDDPNDRMQEELEKMYGDSFKYYLAQSPDKFYVTMGHNSEDILKALIDQPASAAAPSGDIKIALDALANTPYTDSVCSINVLKLMKGFGEMMQTLGTQTNTKPVAAMFSGLKDVQTQSCLVMGGNISDGQAAMRLAVPKQHLVEIIGAVMQMQAQAAAAAPSEIHQHAAHDAAVQEVPKNPLLEWVGKPAPELKMVDLDGKIHRVSRLKGKKTILDFWATWCPPCKKAIPDLIKLRTNSKETELSILGISDEPADTLSPFVKEYKINYPIIADAKDLPAPYGQVTGIPTLFLIDSSGVIRDVIVGYHELEEIQRKLKELK
ncbi:MAG: TlpA family protein disulfide reductase [Planctomycetota bacterium]